MYASQFIYQRGAQVLTKCSKGDKGDPGTNGVKGDKGETVNSGGNGDKGEPGINGINGDKGDMGDKGEPGITGISGARGNVAIVDSIYGDDSTASVGGLPYSTISSAISQVQYGQQVHVLPGTYTFTGTIPDGVVLQGTPPCILQYPVIYSTTMITMGESSRLENFTILLSSTEHVTLTGILFPTTTTSTAQLVNIHLTVQNDSASSTGSSNVTGIQCNGTGGLLTSFAWNSIQNSIIQILSNGGGNKRGMLISNSNVVSIRDTNVYVAAPATSTSTGSYVGVETNDSNNTGSIQIRTSSIGSPQVNGQYTASDILQTTPATITSPTYLASPGIQVCPGTDLVSKKAGGKGFSTYVYPTVLVYGLKGTLHDGFTGSGGATGGYLWYGTQQVSNGNFPDPSPDAAYFRIQQPAILSGMSCAVTTPPGSTNTTTVLVKRTPYNQTIVNTIFTVVFTGTDTQKFFYNGSVDLNAGDKLHVHVSYTGNSQNLTHDLTIQLDLF
jgi:hypothetical protein